MDLFGSVLPDWLGDAGAGVLLLLMAFIGYQLIVRGILPLMRMLAKEFKQAADERQEFFEKTVIPHLTALNENLQKAMDMQRELYEAKLQAIEREHAAERDRLVKQIEELTRQVDELTKRIAKLEAEAKDKEAELAKLRKQLADMTAERDALQAQLKAMEAAKEGANDGKDKPTG